MAVATVTVATCLVICNALSCVHELLCMAFVITKGLPEMLKYDSNYLVGSSFVSETLMLLVGMYGTFL